MRRFGEKLRTLRKRHDMTLQEMIRDLGYANTGYMSLIENGKKKPTAELVFNVARLFHVTMEQLMDDDLELDEG